MNLVRFTSRDKVAVYINPKKVLSITIDPNGDTLISMGYVSVTVLEDVITVLDALTSV